jgi:hypothetical protein
MLDAKLQILFRCSSSWVSLIRNLVENVHASKGIGCYVGLHFVGALLYSDCIALIASTLSLHCANLYKNALAAQKIVIFILIYLRPSVS